MGDTLVYISVPTEQKLGVRVQSVMGHSQVLPGQTVAYPVTDAEGVSLALIADDEDLVTGDRADA